MATEYRSKRGLYMSVFLFVLLLFLRDFCEISISKWIFVILGAVFFFVLCLQDAVALLFFLMPLSVGLPGNYLTILFLLRLLVESKSIHLNIKSFSITILIVCYLFMQGLLAETLTLSLFMMIVGIIVLYLLFSSQAEMNVSMLLAMYSLGVAVMGLIMLTSTLREHSFSELFSPATRLGMGSVDFAQAGTMRVAVDPNYMGLFAISAITLTSSLLHRQELSRGMKCLLVLSAFSAFVVAFIAMSRAFLLMFAVWMLIQLVSNRSMRKYLLLCSMFALILYATNDTVYELVGHVFARFSESNFWGGNGRNELFLAFWEPWTEEPFVFFFGVGMFVCNVHCMPLQYLFGGGLILFVLMILYVWNLLLARNRMKAILEPSRWLPLLVTGGMSLTVPIATSLVFMFPIVVCLFAFELYEANSSG